MAKKNLPTVKPVTDQPAIESEKERYDRRVKENHEKAQALHTKRIAPDIDKAEKLFARVNQSAFEVLYAEDFSDLDSEPIGRVTFLLFVELVRDFVGTDAWNNAVEKMKAKRSASAKIGGDAKAKRPGGSDEKKQNIIAAWKSGKYISRDICAEQECAALGMSFSAARKHLRNK